MKRMNRKGFTIVELVIVIAVIAILAGVLIPTFSGIVNRAQTSATIQEARNMYTEYTGMHDYTKGEPAKNLVIMVKLGEFNTTTKIETGKGEYIIVKNGKIDTSKVYTTLKDAVNAFGQSNSKYAAFDKTSTDALDASLKTKTFIVAYTADAAASDFQNDSTNTHPGYTAE